MQKITKILELLVGLDYVGLVMWIFLADDRLSNGRLVRYDAFQ